MKTMFRNILVIALALTVILGCVGTAFAAGYDPSQGSGSLSNSGGASSSSNKTWVQFMPGDTYEMEAQKGTSVSRDGSISVSVSRGSTVAENKIPGVSGSDAYYQHAGWAIMDEDGNLREIDLDTYNFKTTTKVYAITEDTWPVYSDMAKDRSDWFYLYVRNLSIADVIDGYPNGTFAPQGHVTWGEALKMVMLATGYEVQAATDTHWASGYLTKARADGLVDADQIIVLDDPITRLEYAEVAYRAMDLEKVSIVSPFVDTDAEAVLALYVARIVEGSFNAQGERRFHPDDNITRAELSAVIYRINNYYEA